MSLALMALAYREFRRGRWVSVPWVEMDGRRGLPDRVPDLHGSAAGCARCDWLETASVLGSADVAALFFRIDGHAARARRHGVRAARDCAQGRPGVQWDPLQLGARSSRACWRPISFSKSPWRRIVLVAFVIPLGIVRNGFRILVIGLLCVHVGPHMIDSVIHHRGGPLFFALSLVPLFLLLWWLRRPGTATVGDDVLLPRSRSRLGSSACFWPSSACFAGSRRRRRGASSPGWRRSASTASSPASACARLSSDEVVDWLTPGIHRQVLRPRRSGLASA